MRFSRWAVLGVVTLLTTACAQHASALDEDFDAHLFVVENYLGSSFQLRGVDGDGNGIKEEDQLGLLSAILANNAAVSGLNSAMISEITQGFNANLSAVTSELTVTVGSQGTINLVSQLGDSDPALGNAMQKLIAGYMTMADTSTIAYVNNLADQVIVKILTGTPESGSIGSVQNQINFTSAEFFTFGNAPSQTDFLGAGGDVDGDTITNLNEYSAASGDREQWHIGHGITPPLRLKSLTGGGLAISGISMPFVVETAGGAGAVNFEWRKGSPGSSTLVTEDPGFTIPFLNTSDSGKYYCDYNDGVTVRRTPILSLSVTQVPIFISKNISGGTRIVGGSFTFTVAAQGGSPGPYTYTWKQGGTPINGAPNSPTFTKSNLQLADSGQYSVTVSANGGGSSVTSGPVTLTVNSNLTPLSVISQPGSAVRPLGSSYTFSIAIAGGSGNFNYDWRKGGVSLGAPSQATYTVEEVNESTVGNYTCFVQDQNDGALTVLSNVAVLSITDNPVEIATQPESQVIALTQTATLLVEATGGSGNYTYDWRKDGESLGRSSIPLITIGPVSVSDGGDYTCLVSDTNEPTNNVETDAAVLTVLPVLPLTVSQQPQSVTKDTGQAHTFTIAVSGGTGFYNYDWRLNDESIGAPSSSSYAIPSITVNDAGEYTCVVTDTFQPQLSVTSDVATLSLNLATLLITNQPQGAVKGLGESYTFSITVTGGSADYTYDWRKNGTTLGAASSNKLTLSNLNTGNSGTYTCVVQDNQLPQNVTSDDAVLTVVGATPLAITAQPQGAFKYAGDQHTLNVGVTGGSGTYHFDWRNDGVQVCGGDPLCDTANLQFAALTESDAGNYSCTITDADFPELSITSVSIPLGVEKHLTITRPPRGREILAGQSLKLEVEVEGGYSPVTFAWRLNGQPIADSLDAPEYDAGPARVADEGNYTVFIRDGLTDAIETAPAEVLIELLEIPVSGASFSRVQADGDLNDALTGANVVPPNGSTATGLMNGSLNLTKGDSGATLSFIMNQSIGGALHPVLNLHIGSPAINGPLLTEIPMTPSINSINASVPLTLEEAAIVYGGYAYLSIATDNFPNGEIRSSLFDLVTLTFPHSADENGDFELNLSELLRVIQFYNFGGYHCDEGNSDGFAPGEDILARNCQPHSSDYNVQDWKITLSEILRLIQLFNTGGRKYYICEDSEDGYCPGIEP
ncbi:MAG: CHRD domain-containing protein [Candidatus Hydrogenedens sp.]|nr:CHRD domain-containing protein [Candidatus Hydrogenedens sp.]